MISVIIPTYNSSVTIGSVLSGLYHQKNISQNEFEALVIDDCSTDDTLDILKEFAVRLIVLDKNSGPAAARNRGAQEAQGDLLVFIDSDVILKDDVLAKIKEKFSQRSGIAGLVGIYAKEPANKGPFRTYLALRKYSNWHDPKPEFSSFWLVSLGAIKKEIFLEFGGFDTRYRGTDVEDFELGYRIADKYKILLADDVQGYHYFPGFIKTAKNLFRRSFQWMELFIKRKKFSTEATATRKRGFVNVIGLFSFVMFVASLFYVPLSVLGAILLFIFMLGNLVFYKFAIKEKGILFLIYSVVLDYLFSIIMATAAALSVLNQCRLRVIGK